MVTINDRQFDLMFEKEAINYVFLLRVLQDEYYVKGKTVVCVFCRSGRSFYQSTKESVRVVEE